MGGYNKTDLHNIFEILLKVVLNTITLTPYLQSNILLGILILCSHKIQEKKTKNKKKLSSLIFHYQQISTLYGPDIETSLYEASNCGHMTFNIQESTHEDIGVVRNTEHRISPSLNLTHIIAVDSFLQNF